MQPENRRPWKWSAEPFAAKAARPSRATPRTPQILASSPPRSPPHRRKSAHLIHLRSVTRRVNLTPKAGWMWAPLPPPYIPALDAVLIFVREASTQNAWSTVSVILYGSSPNADNGRSLRSDDRGWSTLSSPLFFLSSSTSSSFFSRSQAPSTHSSHLSHPGVGTLSRIFINPVKLALICAPLDWVTSVRTSDYKPSKQSHTKAASQNRESSFYQHMSAYPALAERGVGVAKPLTPLF